MTSVEVLTLAWNVCDGAEVVARVDWLAGNGGLDAVLGAVENDGHAPVDWLAGNGGLVAVLVAMV